MRLFELAKVILEALYTEKPQRFLYFKVDGIYRVTIEKVELKNRSNIKIIEVDGVPNNLM